CLDWMETPGAAAGLGGKGGAPPAVGGAAVQAPQALHLAEHPAAVEAVASLIQAAAARPPVPDLAVLPATDERAWSRRARLRAVGDRGTYGQCLLGSGRAA